MPFRPASRGSSALFLRLAAERPQSSLIDREIVSAGVSFVYDSTDWVRLWYDDGHAVTSPCGVLTAHRAITTCGRLLWLVRSTGKRRAYHAWSDDPADAMDEAARAWAHRKAVRADWQRIESLARDLRRGRRRFDVRIEDAHRSPLCTLGIEGFLSSLGMGRVTRISGRLAGWLMLIEPQVGFVIHEAERRHAQRAEAPQDRSAPVEA